MSGVGSAQDDKSDKSKTSNNSQSVFEYLKSKFKGADEGSQDKSKTEEKSGEEPIKKFEDKDEPLRNNSLNFNNLVQMRPAE